MKIASWNVNSIKVRLEQVLSWLDESHIDVLALQETKVTDDFFPHKPFTDKGYFVSYSGQKTYNGVAIISKLPIQSTITDIPTFTDIQRRILAATIGPLRLINLYVPNGASVDSEKYHYKLEWLHNITNFIQQELTEHKQVAVVGDFNIAPHDLDVHDPSLLDGQVLVSPAERAAFNKLLDLGLVDSFRDKHPTANEYSWWDYRAAAFRRNHGVRIDHILLNQASIRKCLSAGIDISPRRVERPSDHTPIWAVLDI